MEDHIQRIAEQAKKLAREQMASELNPTFYDAKVFNKLFASLLMQEVVEIIEGNVDTVDTPDDFDKGFEQGMGYAVDLINVYFGLEQDEVTEASS